MMNSIVVFRAVNTGYTAGDMTLTCYTQSSTPALVDTTGFTFTEIFAGIYYMEVPLATVDSIYEIHLTADPTVKYEGTLSTSDILLAEFTEMMGQLLAGTYQAGIVRVPGAAATGAQLIFFEDTNVDDEQFTLSPYWWPYLQDPDTTVWFTMKVTARDPVVLDAQCTIYDALSGVVRMNLTAAQLNIKPTSYFWQLQVRKSITTGIPPVTTIERRIAQEGTALVKPTYKQ